MDHKIKVLVVGSNPSIRSPDLSPFHASTRSRMVLDQWFSGIDAEIHFLNLIDETRPGNRALSRVEIKSIIPGIKSHLERFSEHKIIAVGKAAEMALTEVGCRFFAMPHPSGRNRLLNDKEFIADKIKKKAEFICHF